LRNKYQGGSNEHEYPAQNPHKSKVYYALPATFYSDKTHEEIEHKGKKTMTRRYKPDYSKSNLAAALREGNQAENVEADRVIDNSLL
jgi:hypothetical protein